MSDPMLENKNSDRVVKQVLRVFETSRLPGVLYRLILDENDVYWIQVACAEEVYWVSSSCNPFLPEFAHLIERVKALENFITNMAKDMKDLDPVIAKRFNDEFWNLLEENKDGEK